MSVIEEVYNKELIKLIRKQTIEVLAEEIVRVQPIDPNLIIDLYKISKNKEELEQEGYRPVSEMGLIYIKDNK